VGPARARDADRARVYAAEQAAFEGTLAEEPLSGAELSALVDAVIASAPWRAAGLPRPELRPARRDAARSSATCDAGRWVVRVAAGQATATTVAHELAHVAAGAEHGHGAAFRRAYLDVVGLVLGEPGRRLLAGELTAHGLRAPAASWPAAPGHGALGDVVAARAQRLLGATPR